MSYVIGLNKIAKEALNDIEIDVKRSYRTEFVPAGINVRLALLMIKIASIQSNENVLDPFCGSGVIPIECALAGLGNKIFGSDIMGNAIKKSLINAKNAEIGKKVKFFQSDVINIRLPSGLINVIITNLPFGIRVSSHNYNEEIYLKLYNKYYAAFRERLRDVGRIGLPVGRQEGGADDVVHIHQWPKPLRLLGGEEMHLQAEAARGRGLTLHLDPAVGVAGEPKPAVTLPPRGVARFGFELLVQFHRIAEQARDVGVGS